ncbi:MAG: hypothetical protein V4485_02575 [Pseudomonadota bacterium]
MKRIEVTSNTRPDVESDTETRSDTSEEGIPRDIISNAKYIKITPQEIEAELTRDISLSGAKPRQSIAQLQEEKIYGICLALRDIASATKGLECEGYTVVYRFHGTRRKDKVHGGNAVKPHLKAKSEVTGKAPKTVEQLKDLAHIHASQNKKSLVDVDSSFVSTVTDVTKLIQHTFPAEADSPLADPQLRHRVFNNAPYLSAFCVPSGSLSRIKEGRGNGESEMI